MVEMFHFEESTFDDLTFKLLIVPLRHDKGLNLGTRSYRLAKKISQRVPMPRPITRLMVGSWGRLNMHCRYGPERSYGFQSDNVWAHRLRM